MKIIKASTGSVSEMLDAMKSALDDAGVSASVKAATDIDTDYINRLIDGVENELYEEFSSIEFETKKDVLIVRCMYEDIAVELEVPYSDLFMTEGKLQQDIWYIANTAIEELENSL